jgi:hypothetical protein
VSCFAVRADLREWVQEFALAQTASPETGVQAVGDGPE